MEEILKGNIVHAPRLGELSVTEKGCMVLRDGIIQGIYQEVPEAYRNAPVTDYGDALIMQSFADMHLHAPQYPMLGMGMDLPLVLLISADELFDATLAGVDKTHASQ